MSTASKKRKLSDVATKYYAVRAGKEPGVYLTWQECQENTTGFKGAQYKSFLNEKDANDFVAGKSTPATAGSSKNSTQKFYGVAVGHVPGVYTDWTEASKQVKDAQGPKYKKFETRAEAEEFVRTKGTASKNSKGAAAKKDTATTNGYCEGGPSAKKAKTASATKLKKDGFLRVYTDGSSRGNGRTGALAGVGVFFGDNDPRNVSEALEGTPQTNQRAELTGILRALEIAPRERDMEIITDSKYSIDCVTNWYINWAKKGWISSTGEPVKNQDLVVAVRALIEQRDARGTKTKFTWIKGHANDPGNEAADHLAVAGAVRPR